MAKSPGAPAVLSLPRIAVCLLVVASAVATPVMVGAGPSIRGSARTLSARGCSRLFGAADLVEANRVRRTRSLCWVDQDKRYTTVIHASDTWRPPIRLRLAGIRPVQNGQPAGPPRAAMIEVSTALAGRLGCRAGRYEVRVDDAVGRDTRVLAVLRGGLLVERAGVLRYLARGAKRLPRWYTAWGLGPGPCDPR